MDFLSFFYMPLTVEFITKFIGINVLIVYNVEFIVFSSLMLCYRHFFILEIQLCMEYSVQRKFFPTFLFSLC